MESVIVKGQEKKMPVTWGAGNDTTTLGRNFILFCFDFLSYFEYYLDNLEI